MKINLTRCAISLALLGSMATAFAATGAGAAAPALTRAPTTAGTTINLPTQAPQLSPPDLAMVALTPSKTTVNRMEVFQLAYTIKNVSNKPVAHARIHLTADWYQLNDYIDVGPLAAGQEKTGTTNLTVMKDSMMGKSPEPYPVHIKFTGAAQIVGANNGAVPDLNPGNDEKTTVTVTANPG